LGQAIAEAAAGSAAHGDVSSRPHAAELLRQTPPNSLAAALERRLCRLAYDLHDGALQELAALAAEVRSMRRQIVPLVDGDMRERVDGRFDDVHARLASVDESLRALVASVKGQPEPTEALDTRIARDVAALRDETGIEADLEIMGSFSDLTESRRIAIFQVVHEALANIREHSGARHLSVRVVEREGRVEVSVEDDGAGFDSEAAFLEASVLRRFGLYGMRERVAMLGSELYIDSEPGTGTRVSFTLERWVPSHPVT
jgi:signal transduction histidine kinase